MCNKMWKILLLALTLALLALPAASSALAQAAAQDEGLVLWEETIFLGEAVPLRRKGQSLENLLKSRFSEPGEVECWWMSPQGPLPLAELGKQRPRADCGYPLAAVLRQPDKPERWVHGVCRIHVASGTVRVWAGGEGIGTASQALVKLEGAGLTLYRQAQLEAGPQGGVPALETEFTGLPFGVYTLSVADGGLEPSQVQCRLGVCQEDDTVDPDRRIALVRFKASGGTGSAVRESYRLGGGS